MEAHPRKGDVYRQENAANSKDRAKVLGGLGISIISTSKGVMSGAKARKAKVGGELLAKVW